MLIDLNVASSPLGTGVHAVAGRSSCVPMVLRASSLVSTSCEYGALRDPWSPAVYLFQRFAGESICKSSWSSMPFVATTTQHYPIENQQLSGVAWCGAWEEEQ